MKRFIEGICQECRSVYEKLSEKERKRGIGFYKNHLLGRKSGTLCGRQINGRKPYKKPAIKTIPLRPQEAVLGFCKTSQSQGPRIGTCTRPGMCLIEGS